MVGEMPLSVKAIGNGTFLGSTRGQLPHESAPFFPMSIDIRSLQEWPVFFAIEDMAEEGRVARQHKIIR
ncbi:hypothetical protein D3C85_1716560 [compost metagenome]